LNYLMLMIYAGIAMGPAICTTLGVRSMRYLMHAHAHDEHYVYFISLGALSFAMYVVFQWRHHFVPYDAVAFTAATMLNGTMTVATLVAMALAMIWEPNWVQWWGLFYVVFPVMLNAFIPDFQALKMLINPFNWIAYIAFMPTMQGYFLSLAIARTFDLSWGNRAGVGEEAENLKVESRSLIVLQNVLNLIVLGLTFHFGSDLTTRIEIILAVLLLAPMVLIGTFSALQALGMVTFSWVVVLEGLLAMYAFSHIGWLQSAMSEHVKDFIIDYFPAGTLCMILFFVLILKSIGLKCVLPCLGRWRKWRAPGVSPTAAASEVMLGSEP